MTEDIDPTLGLSRRRLLRRGTAAGGMLVWTVPVVHTVGRSAMAEDAGSLPPADAVSLQDAG